jgi:hypothetical protein
VRRQNDANDGSQHADNDTDRQRHRRFHKKNHRVVRFWNNDVNANIEGVLEVTAKALQVERPANPDSTSGRGPGVESDLSPQAGRGDRGARPSQ